MIPTRGVAKANYWRGDSPNFSTKETFLNLSTSTIVVLQLCQQG